MLFFNSYGFKNVSNVNISIGGSLKNEIKVVLIPGINLANEDHDRRESHFSVNEQERPDIAQMVEFIFHIFLKLPNRDEFKNNQKNLSEPQRRSCFYNLRESLLFSSSERDYDLDYRFSFGF